jgi:uncharacterized protein (DUF4415 family)
MRPCRSTRRLTPTANPTTRTTPPPWTAYWSGATIKRELGPSCRIVKRPTLNMRVDAEVLEAFKATGPGWQTRINALLRDAIKRGVVKA